MKGRKKTDREEMHRQIRLMLAEDNLPEQERIFYEMLEDIRECAMCGADAGKSWRNGNSGIFPKDNRLQKGRR